jgi:hypothetical protein
MSKLASQALLKAFCRFLDFIRPLAKQSTMQVIRLSGLVIQTDCALIDKRGTIFKRFQMSLHLNM